ncbi:NAD(P)/FAD-dependent oxidoreductase [Acidimicrobiia bacterium EGI L10123]|uniref:dihydrolipoyl dehydrogenase family protein n=1 Tax=Salinilacustrithrix flava TaxID=2957203 RepID=UPI003D7C163D|nr:NAD(P)/FAD-dependent oxidoreductase [Acidimicrobiia bacterium EGI L10123]
MTSQIIDVAIIGLGSAGEALATALAEQGLHVVGFEPDRVGGECPFTACMPSKSLLHDATSGSSWDDARRHRDEVIEHLDDGSHAEALQAAGVTLIRSRAGLVDEGIVEADGRRWRARHVVLATGSAPVVPPVDGLDDVTWLTSDELMVADDLPESLLVLGGGAIGCEAATIMAGFDRPVTVVEAGALLAGGVDVAVADRLAVQLRDSGIEVCTDAEMATVSETSGGIRATLSTGAAIEAAAMLVATGQAPRWSGLGLDHVGLDDDPAVDDEYRVEGRDWLRAIGDVNGRSPWTHGANHEARRLARLLTDTPPGSLTEQMAHCVFTDPPVAAIGLTAEAAADEGHDVVVGTARYSDVARYATDDLGDGVVVVVADRTTGAMLGCSGTGARFDDVIGIVAALLHCGCTVQDAAELVLPFPTIGQVLTPAFRDAADAIG